MGDRLATIDMGRQEGGCCSPFGGGAGSPSNILWPGPRSTSVPSGILIHPTVWPQQTSWAKNWGLCPFGHGWVPIKHNAVWAEVYLPTKWRLDPSTLWPQYMGRKVGAAVLPFLGKGSWSSCNRMPSGPRSSSVPSGILIHPAVWP